MTEILAAVPPADDVPECVPDAVSVASQDPPREAMAERVAIAQLVRAARARGEDLTGPDGLLKLLTKTVLETALDEEMSEHLGYDKHAPEGRDRGNSRNGARTKTVLTDNVGPVKIEVPRDRDGTFDRSSCASGNAAWVMSTRWCCRCMPKD